MGARAVTLSQGRFETGPKASQRLTWRIPVRLKSVRTGAIEELLLGKDGAPATTTIDGCGPVIVNAGQAGYFRTRYSEADLAALAAELPTVAEIDRLGVLNDTWALGEAGELPVTSYLQLAKAVSIDSDPLILIAVGGHARRASTGTSTGRVGSATGGRLRARGCSRSLSAWDGRLRAGNRTRSRCCERR